METPSFFEDADENETEESEENSKRIRLLRRQTAVRQSRKICAKEERIASIKRVTSILQKSEAERSAEENLVLQECPETVEEIQERWRKREEAKRRLEEFEDPEEELNRKCQILAQAVAQSRHLVVYTGAGISTAAKIPDYRGPNGIWTRLKEGKDIGEHNLTLAEPTFTHMALYELYRQKILKYVVSQNCDGLHLRSGLPRTALSELHGNMYIEVCKQCKKEYWRLFDVTENTARYSHKTSRKCYSCNEPLVDTIVHFGERGSLLWPLNWKGACKNAREATTILCLGSSLKVLKKYSWLWQMHKPIKRRPNLYIVNLQWTPKDDCANVKINGKCDFVMQKIMSILGVDVPQYKKYNDPIFVHCTKLHELESHTTTQPILELDEVQTKEDCPTSDLKQACDIPCLPVVKKEKITHVPTNGPSFSIDNILNGTTNTAATITQPFFPFPILNYNFLHQTLWGGYSDFFLYPYQTSFLYPGLHSIINPMPVIREEDLLPKVEKIDPECGFCDQRYNSLDCVFYKSSEAVFANQEYRKSRSTGEEKPNVCVCCDFSTEDEDVEYSDEKNEKEMRKTQPGWFGKGYKKGKRKRKAL